MLGGQDSSRCHHDQLDVGNGHAGTFGFFLSILQHDDVLGDAVGLRVVLVHVRAQRKHVHGMKAATVEVQEGHDLKGGDLSVERFGVLEVVVPYLVHHVAEEFGAATFGRFVVGVVLEFGLVGRFRTDTNHSRSIVRDVQIVESEPRGADEVVSPVGGSILGVVREEGGQGVDPADSVIRDDNQEREQGLPDGKEVVIRGFSLKRRKNIVRLFEEENDGVRTHDDLGGFLWGWAGAVKDRNDDDQSDCVGSSELG